MKRDAISNVEELDLVSAIWILASNDENSLVSYRGIQFRLDLPLDFDIKALVAKRPELFRPGASAAHVDSWKSDMLQGRHLPTWIKSVSGEAERKATIRALSSNDVFRSQFRGGRGAERSPIEIIEWGLEHLDRLRKAKADATEASVKRWQMWLVFWVSAIGVVSQFAIAYAKYKGWI